MMFTILRIELWIDLKLKGSHLFGINQEKIITFPDNLTFKNHCINFDIHTAVFVFLFFSTGAGIMKKLRIFIDTANTTEVKDAVNTGLIDGVATNPGKIAESGKSYREVVEEIRQFFDGPIAVQAVGRTTDEICECARRLHQIDSYLAVKITANKAGLAAVKILVPEGIRTNATLIFNPAQALLAGLAGSLFISPFISRARMTGHDGVEVIRKIRKLFDAFGLADTNMIAASIKDVSQVIDSIIAGADSIAVPFSVFEAMCEHPLTSAGLDAFLKDYINIPQD